MTSFSELAFKFRITPGLLAGGLVFSALMGAVGGLLPATSRGPHSCRPRAARDLISVAKLSCRLRVLARPGLGAAGVRRAVLVGVRRALGGLALPARHRADAGVPSLLRAPRVPDEPRGAVRVDVHRHGGDAEGAALVGRPSREPPQVRRSRRRSAQPDGQRLLLRAHRLVPERHEARQARGDQPGRSATSRSSRRSASSTSTSSCRRSLLAVALYLDRRAAVAGLGLLPADDDAGARDVRDQHRQPPVRIAPLRHASTSRATTRSRRSSRSARAGTTTTTATSARRATASTGGSSIRPGTSSARWQPSASRGTCSRCRSGSTKRRAPSRRSARRPMPSVVDACRSSSPTTRSDEPNALPMRRPDSPQRRLPGSAAQAQAVV